MDNKIYLNLGCFNKPFPKPFINVDVRTDTHADIICDVIKLDAFQNNTVDLIYASHLFEHIKRKDIQIALGHWHRVLKPNAILRLAVPDLEAICQHYIFNKDAKILQHLLFGSQHHDYDYHYVGYDFQYLSEVLTEAGFSNIRKYDWQTTWPHNYIDDYSQAYLPDGCKTYKYGTNNRTVNLGGKLMSLNVEATK